MILLNILILCFTFSFSIADSSETLIEKFIRNNSDFSKDPCDDFNEHVCPTGKYKRYHEEMSTIRGQIVAENQEKLLPVAVITSIDNPGKLFTDVVKFLETEDAIDFCNAHSDLMWSISEFFPDPDENRKNCTEIIMLIRRTTSDSTFVDWRTKMFITFEEHIILQTFKDADRKVHNVFERMRNEVRQVFKKTPWLVSKNAVDAYIKKLDAMVFMTMGDFKANVEKLAADYSTKVENCTKELGSEYNATRVKSICEFVATAVLREDTIIATATVGEKTKTIWDFHEKLLNENGMIFWDQVILLASPLVIIANTTSDAVLYGTFGVVMYHEIMHGFIFSENDYIHDLKELWTDNSDCVNLQMEKTCATFPVFKCPNSNQTFEEDASDMAAYRLAWNTFKKPMMRKTFISNYHDISKDQLFFYGLAVTYCNDFWNNRNTMVHSHSAHRINSLASSFDEFATAFQCKSTDKMVQNKAGDCILYGEQSALKNKTLSNKTDNQ